MLCNWLVVNGTAPALHIAASLVLVKNKFRPLGLAPRLQLNRAVLRTHCAFFWPRQPVITSHCGTLHVRVPTAFTLRTLVQNQDYCKRLSTKDGLKEYATGFLG